jgi:hypothetical protein
MLLMLYTPEKRLLHPHCIRKVDEKAGGDQRFSETDCIHLPAVYTYLLTYLLTYSIEQGSFLRS